MTIKKRLLRTLIIIVIGLSIGGLIGLMQLQMPNHAQVVNKGSRAVEGGMAGVNLGGGFDLVHHTGQAVSEADYAGKYKFIYFGFTYCPAICPTELQRMAQVYSALEEERQSRIEMLFISVDPERDTPEIMADYVSLFHPELHGLTGTNAQIDEVMKDYRIFATKVPLDDGNDYTVDHSSFLYLMSPENKPLAIFRMKDSVDYMVAEIRKNMPLKNTQHSN